MTRIERDPDRRWWWTGAMVAVQVLWAWSLVARPAHYDVADDRVLAWAAFLSRHADVGGAETIASLAFLVAFGAALLHVMGALAYREAGVTPLVPAVLVTLAAMVMVPAGTAYLVGMMDFAGARMTWWPPVLLGSAVVLAVAGVMSWRIALVDRRRERTELFLLEARWRELSAGGRPPAPDLLDRGGARQVGR